MSNVHYTDFALALARVWLGAMIFAHGWRHLRATRSGPGISNWFESLGIKPGPLHAWNVTLTELAAGVAVLSISLGTLGPGQWSLDNAVGFSFPFENGTALLITALVGLGGTAAFLGAFWRPPRKQPA